jgi:hypothetical protein
MRLFLLQVRVEELRYQSVKVNEPAKPGKEKTESGEGYLFSWGNEFFFPQIYKKFC